MANQFIRGLYLLRIHLVFVASIGLPEDIPTENLYLYNGDTANLVCPYMSMEHRAQWRGPVDLTVYTDDGRIKKSLANYERLQIVYSNATGERSLLINSFSETDEGLYRCITMLNGSAVQKDFMVILLKPPSNMTVSNVSADGTIHVLEGTKITLSCYVASGVPDERMTWISNDILLNNGGPGYLGYIFIPTRIDHLRYFTCSASNGNKFEPLYQRVQLKVVFIPKVIINGNDKIQISEGQQLVLTCAVDTNMKNYTLKWIIKDNVDITDKDTSDNIVNSFDENFPKSTLTIFRISRNYNGPIQCRAINEAGIGTDTIDIYVKYKPVIISNISLEIVKTEIGEPANISIMVESSETLKIAWTFSSGGMLGLWSIRKTMNESNDTDTFILSSIIVPRRHKHFGNYKVRVRNSEGSDDMTFKLTYKEWHVHFIPKKLIVNTSEIVQMCCMVNPKHYTGWTIKIYHYWNGVFIRQFGDIEVYQNTANLSLSYSEYTDTGEYVCSMNIHEAIFTSAVSLHVLGPPIITRKRIKQSRTSIELHVDLYSNPLHSYIEWFSNRNGKEIKTSVNNLQAKQVAVNTTVFISSYKVNVPVRGINIKLTILKKEIIKMDKYICHIKNSIGAAETSFDMLMHPATFTYAATEIPDKTHSNITNITNEYDIMRIQRCILIGLICVFAITNAILIAFIVVRKWHARSRVLNEIIDFTPNETRRVDEIELERISHDHIYSYCYEEIQSMNVGAVSFSGESEYSETSSGSCDKNSIQQNSKYDDLCYSHKRRSLFDNDPTKNLMYSSLFVFPRCVKSEKSINSHCDIIDTSALKNKRKVIKSF